MRCGRWVFWPPVSYGRLCIGSAQGHGPGELSAGVRALRQVGELSVVSWAGLFVFQRRPGDPPQPTKCGTTVFFRVSNLANGNLLSRSPQTQRRRAIRALAGALSDPGSAQRPVACHSFDCRRAVCIRRCFLRAGETVGCCGWCAPGWWLAAQWSMVSATSSITPATRPCAGVMGCGR